MTTINIDRKALRAVSRFQGDKDIRYYLNAVCVKSTPIETRIIATDGFTLAMHRGMWKGENIGTCAEIIVPRDAVKAMLAWKSQIPVITLILPDDFATGGECRAQSAGNVVLFKVIDARFPGYMRVFPKTVSGEAGAYDAEYLKRVQDAASDFTSTGKKKSFAHIWQNGSNCAVCTVSSSDSFVAVIMPVKVDAPSSDEWAWAFDAIQTETVPEQPE